MRPASCSACVPRIATAIASSHMRMRAQLPMFTTSETAPMVQKLVRFATAPKTKGSAKPPSTTTRAGLEMPLDKEKRLRERASILPLVARGIRDPGRDEPLAADAARIASPAGASLGVRVVAGHGEREIHSQVGSLAHDVRLLHAHDRRADRERLALHGALGGEVGHVLEGGKGLGPAVR